KTHKYWIVAFVGYAVNMLAVPALALAGKWPVAAALIIAERTGRAIRRPSVEAMISYAGKEIGHGWVFGLNEALDQSGATVGPLIVALVLYLRKEVIDTASQYYFFRLFSVWARLSLPASYSPDRIRWNRSRQSH